MTSQDRPIYFQHIPKTAGNSVKVWLGSHYGERLCPADLADHLVMIPPEKRGATKHSLATFTATSIPISVVTWLP